MNQVLDAGEMRMFTLDSRSGKYWDMVALLPAWVLFKLRANFYFLQQEMKHHNLSIALLADICKIVPLRMKKGMKSWKLPSIRKRKLTLPKVAPPMESWHHHLHNTSRKNWDLKGLKCLKHLLACQIQIAQRSKKR